MAFEVSQLSTPIVGILLIPAQFLLNKLKVSWAFEGMLNTLFFVNWLVLVFRKLDFSSKFIKENFYFDEKKWYTCLTSLFWHESYADLIVNFLPLFLIGVTSQSKLKTGVSFLFFYLYTGIIVLLTREFCGSYFGLSTDQGPIVIPFAAYAVFGLNVGQRGVLNFGHSSVDCYPIIFLFDMFNINHNMSSFCSIVFIYLILRIAYEYAISKKGNNKTLSYYLGCLVALTFGLVYSTLRS